MKSISQDLLIIADDLTGACDAAAPFALVGRSLSCRVRAYSTESRDLSKTEIVARMNAIAHSAGQAALIFKKIDSTLRGNVEAEIDAAFEAFACASAVITPAFPEMGRTVREGHLHIDGVLAKKAIRDCLDAVTNEDLDQIVDNGLRLPGRVLWAGSAGLAAALARRLYGNPAPDNPPPLEAPMVFCIGSDHPATLSQQAELRQRCPDARIVPIRRCQTSAEEIRRGVARAGALFITGGDTASMVLQAVGAKTITIRHEVVTGVPWGLLSGGMFHGRPVVTKSGGFGPPDALVKVARYFRCK